MCHFQPSNVGLSLKGTVKIFFQIILFVAIWTKFRLIHVTVGILSHLGLRNQGTVATCYKHHIVFLDLLLSSCKVKHLVPGIVKISPEIRMSDNPKVVNGFHL